MVSDDRVILRRDGAGITMHGTPWHGDAEFAEPIAAPLARIFLLRQAPRHATVPLTPASAAALLFSCSFPVFHDPDALDRTLALLSSIVQTVPVEALAFAPTRDVTDFVRGERGRELTSVQRREKTMNPEATAANLRSTIEFVELCDVLLAQGQVVRFTAEGWSMYPAIRDGEIVDLAPVDISAIRRGDVLLCRLGWGAVAHRVIAIDRTADPDPDSPAWRRGVRPRRAAHGDAILGQVIATTRTGVRRRLDTPLARILGSLTARAWRAKRWLRERLVLRVPGTEEAERTGQDQHEAQRHEGRRFPVPETGVPR